MGLSIFTVYGRNVCYTVRSAATWFTQDGRIDKQDTGFRFDNQVFRYYGKRRDPDSGETILGIRREGLAQSSKMRRNRALTELRLSEAAAHMRRHGFKDASERMVLDWFLDNHGGTKGIDWNVYDTETGALIADEELSTAVQSKAQPGGKPPVFEEPDFDDARFLVHDRVNKEWRCDACGVGPKKAGMAGHRRSNMHRENVLARLLPETSSTAAGAA